MSTPAITPSAPSSVGVGAGDGKSDMEILGGSAPASVPDNPPATPDAPDAPPAAPVTPAEPPAEPGTPPAAPAPEGPKPVAIGESMPEALRRASASDPAVRAEVNRVWSQLQNYLPLGSHQELKALRDKFPGGVAEAEAIINDALGIQQVDQAFYNGTPEQRSQLITDLYKDSPEALVSTTSATLQFLEKAAPQDYAKVSDSVISSELRSGRIGGYLQMLKDNVGNPEQLTKLVNDIYNWASEKAGVTKPAQDPRQAELERQRADLDRQRSDFDNKQWTNYTNSFNNTVLGEVNTAIEATLAPLLTEVPVTAKAKELISGTIADQLEEVLKADKTLQYQLQQIDSLRRYDDATKNQRVKLTVDRAKAYLPEIARSVFNEWTTSIVATNNATLGKKQAAATRKDIVGTGGGDMRRQPTPKSTEVDYSKTSDADILAGNITRRS